MSYVIWSHTSLHSSNGQLEHVLCPEKTVSTADNSGIDEDLTAAEVSSISAEMRAFSRSKTMLPFVTVSSGCAVYNAFKRPLTVPSCYYEWKNQIVWLIDHVYADFSGSVVFLYYLFVVYVLVNSNCWWKGIARTNNLSLSLNISILYALTLFYYH